MILLGSLASRQRRGLWCFKFRAIVVWNSECEWTTYTLNKTCSELKATQALRTQTCAAVGMECCFGSGMTSDFWVNIVCFVFLFAPRFEQTTETLPRGRCWWPAASLLRLDRAALSEALNNSQMLCLSLNTMFNTSHSKLKATNDHFHCYHHWTRGTTTKRMS